jgi:hypothetical protein
MEKEISESKGVLSVSDLMLEATPPLTGKLGHTGTILEPLKPSKQRLAMRDAMQKEFLMGKSKRQLPIPKSSRPFHWRVFLKRLKFWRRTPGHSLTLGVLFPGLVHGKRNIIGYTLRNQKGDPTGITEILGAAWAFISEAYIGVSVGTEAIGFYVGDVIGYVVGIGGSMLLTSMTSKNKKPSSLVSGSLMVYRRQG